MEAERDRVPEVSAVWRGEEVWSVLGVRDSRKLECRERREAKGPGSPSEMDPGAGIWAMLGFEVGAHC